MSLEEKLVHLAEDLEPFGDPQERLGFLVDRARRSPPLPAEERTEAHRVRGCISTVWLVGETRDGRCHFRFDADSPLVRGLVGFLCSFYDGASPADIATSELDPLDALGLLATLSPTRRNGLASARAAIREYARRFA